MKKELTKEDLIEYLKTLPESLWLSLPGAGTVVRDAAIGTLQERGHTAEGRHSFSGALCDAMAWCETSQGDEFWRTLYGKIPSGLGIDLPDPTPFPEVKSGMKVLLKTVPELLATPGAEERYGEISLPGNMTVWNHHGMDSLAGTIVTIGECGWTIVGWMVKSIVPDTPYLSKADDPRVKDLIGKKVYYSDSLDSIMGSTENLEVAYLIASRVGEDTRYPFRVAGYPSVSRDSTYIYSYILPYVEPETVEVTMEEVCSKFGKNVKIKKD